MPSERNGRVDIKLIVLQEDFKADSIVLNMHDEIIGAGGV